MKYHTCLLFFVLLITFLTKESPVMSQSPAGSPKGPPKGKSFTISCGATEEESDADGQNWQPDDNYLNPAATGEIATASYQDPNLDSSVPFMSARIFKSPGGYKFPVPSDARVMIRFYFYAATYGDLDTANSYFALKANGYELLNNFSASLVTKALTQAYIVKEFSLLAPEDGEVNIVFTPSKNYKDTFAFINGIQVIPMMNIYNDTPSLVGFADQTLDMTTYSLQTMYRLNVGGQVIPPSNDSAGLERTWYNDAPYLFGGGSGRAPAVPVSEIKYPTSQVPESIAPALVYASARTMSANYKMNLNFNLTWIFQVDANYTYYVRLHFCEIELRKPNQRTFHIYMNNRTAQLTADVIAWSGGQDIPIYKDYAVYQSDKSDKHLWIALTPNDDSHPEFLDAILNGIEIFKLNNVKKSFAAPNPEISEMMSLVEEAKKKKEFSSGSGTAQMIGAVAGGATGLAAVIVVSAVLFNKKRRLNSTPSASSNNWLPLYGNSHSSGKSTGSRKSTNSSNLSSLAQGLCRHFSLQEIRQATKNFDEGRVIGVGGFGKVYKGVIDGGAMQVAIKRSNPQSEQGVNEFETEIEMLSKLRHKHLVSLIGFCDEDNEMALVYDYMANGTLREHLYKGNQPSLPWKQRLEICIGSARGLHYLHTGAKYTIIHRDVKTTNILLDDKWVAKVSDFGLSKTGPNLNNQAHVSTVVKGSFGYLDPEYFRRQQLTEKSDVYSFGVVLFEVLCARPALNPSLPKEQVSLGDWALQCQRKGKLEEIIDPVLKGDINKECLKKFAETAEKCLSDAGIHRPSMGDVLWNLEFAMQLQENPGAAAGEKGGEIGGGRKRGLSKVEEEEVSALVDDDTDDSEIFSQIVNPKGR
ncbi:Receptor-like protein kinase ANXUR1 [Linum perenne]